MMAKGERHTLQWFVLPSTCMHTKIFLQETALRNQQQPFPITGTSVRVWANVKQVYEVYTFSQIQCQKFLKTVLAKFLSSNVLRMHFNRKWKSSVHT